MRKRRAAVLATGVAALLVTPAATSSATDDNATESANVFCQRSLAATDRAFGQAFNDRDARKLGGFFLDDATLINPTGSTRTGKADIESAFAFLFANPFDATVTPVRTTVEGCRTAIVISDFQLHDPSDDSTSRFRASLTYTLDRGHWRVLLDQSTLLP